MRVLTASIVMGPLMLIGALLFSAPIANAQTSEVTSGLYATRMADCMACHTQAGGTPFAGGREIGTPYGSVSSTNITPDPDTGIGKWTDDDFYRALHDGIGRDGKYLYPVMPYPSYTKMTREDVLAIKAYLFSLKPVFAPRAPSNMEFPFDIRATLFVWRELYFSPGAFAANPAHSVEWNRGAYLVEGPGHCGACHSPRNVLGGTEARASLAGGDVQQWLAPNISSDPLDGIGERSVNNIVTFLRTGADRPMGVAFGPMAEVVHDSLRYATNTDLHDIAVFLKEGPDRAGPAIAAAELVDLKLGQHLYLANCAACHQDNGRGIAGVVPNLAGNAAIAAEHPTDLIVAVLQGLPRSGGSSRMPSFAGSLDDRSIANIANYVRTAWHDKAPANVTPAMVAALRPTAKVGAAGTEAARDFDCPRVGSGSVSGTLANAGQADFLATDDGAFLDRRIYELVAQIRQQQPGISDARLTNNMIAAFCPAVANMPGLSNGAKRAKLMQLATRVQEQIAATASPPGSPVVASVPLPSGLAQKVYNAAAARHQTAGTYMEGLIAKQSQEK